MNDKIIDIKLDPLTDGLCSKSVDNIDFQNNQALIIGTNRDYRMANMTEIVNIIDSFKGNMSTLSLYDSDYLIIYNNKKTFSTIEGSFFVGSFIVTRINGNMIFPISSDEIDTIMDLIEDHMVEMNNGNQKFSALEVD